MPEQLLEMHIQQLAQAYRQYGLYDLIIIIYGAIA
jgi:hypothetical protein